MHIFTNFSYKDATGKLTRIPVRYGDMNRQVAQILKQNSENTIPSAPFIACYIKDLQFDRARLQDPTFVSKIHIREREYDEVNNRYLTTQGSNYTIERIMPTPYNITFNMDLWTSNTDQKLQIIEQMAVLFTPSFEIQSTDNYIDWTSLSVVDIESQIWSSRAIPQGVAEDIDILTWTFKSPIWITPPAKVKKLGVITKIIANIFAVGAQGTIASVYNERDAAEMFSGIQPDASITITPGDFDLLVLNNTAKLVAMQHNLSDEEVLLNQQGISWMSVLDPHPGKFRAGLSQLRFGPAADQEIVAYVSLDPSDSTTMILNIDPDTIPTNTIIEGRGTIDAIINPLTFNPSGVSAGTRYLILDDINPTKDEYGLDYDGPDAWKNSDNSDFQAFANDIIEWDGTNWRVVFSSSHVSEVVFITNTYTGTQYKWTDGSWSKTFEGLYDKRLWRLVL